MTRIPTGPYPVPQLRRYDARLRISYHCSHGFVTPFSPQKRDKKIVVTYLAPFKHNFEPLDRTFPTASDTKRRAGFEWPNQFHGFDRQFACNLTRRVASDDCDAPHRIFAKNLAQNAAQPNSQPAVDFDRTATTGVSDHRTACIKH